MFDDIAGSYDRLNDLMTAGLHHRWRDMGVMLAGVGPGCSALDVCCGTGDFAFALKEKVGAAGRVVGVDVSEEMLAVAREKCGRNQLYVEFRLGDVLDLPFGVGEFDACTVGFGIRNVADIPRAFEEMRRVCRPGAEWFASRSRRPASRCSSSSTPSGSTTPFLTWAGWLLGTRLHIATCLLQ